MKNRDVHREHQAWHLNMIIIKDSIIWILKVTVAGSSLSFIFFSLLNWRMKGRFYQCSSGFFKAPYFRIQVLNLRQPQGCSEYLKQMQNVWTFFSGEGS